MPPGSRHMHMCSEVDDSFASRDRSDPIRTRTDIAAGIHLGWGFVRQGPDGVADHVPASREADAQRPPHESRCARDQDNGQGSAFPALNFRERLLDAIGGLWQTELMPREFDLQP